MIHEIAQNEGIYRQNNAEINIENQVRNKLTVDSAIQYDKYLLTVTSTGTLEQMESLKIKLNLCHDFSNTFGISKIRGNWWESYVEDMVNVEKEGGVKLKNGKKPERLLRDIIYFTTNTGDIVLDYHAGSGTTCAVAHKMGRQYIGIEQLNYKENNPEIRLKNVINGDESGISKIVNWQGGGDFVYLELAKWNEKAKEEIQNAKDLTALVKLFDTLYEKYFLNYNVKIKGFKEEIIKEENFKKLTLVEQKRMFLTMLDLNQMYVNESEISDKKYEISSEDQKLTKAFYSKK